MKKLLLSLLVCVWAISIQAQSKEEIPEVRSATDALVQLYSLDEKQTGEMYIIQARQQRNFQSIQQFKDTNVKLYNQKRSVIHEGTAASIKKMLNEEQKVTYQEQTLLKRQKVANKMEELKMTGASMEAIETAILDLQDPK